MSNSNAVCNTNEAAQVQSLVANTVRGNARLGTVSGFLLVVLGVLAIATPFITGMATSTLISAIMIAAGARYPDDELLIAGAIRSRGIPVSRGVTVDVDIPAEAEIVVEGYLGAHERQAEGPLAEFHGYFGDLWESPVFHVTAVCCTSRPPGKIV